MSARTKQRQFIAIYGCTRMFSLAIVMYYKTFLLSCLTYMLVCWWRWFLRTWKLMIQRETHSTYFTGLTCRDVKKTNSVWVLCTSGEPRRFINELLNMYKCLGRLLFVFYLEMAGMNWITRILAVVVYVFRSCCIVMQIVRWPTCRPPDTNFQPA